MPQQVIQGDVHDIIAIRGIANEPIPVDIGQNITVDVGNIDIGASVEVSNDVGNPVPVNGTVNTLAGLEIPPHDYVSLSYTGTNLTGVTYKDGGSGGTTVATLTLAYDGSDNLTSVTKS